MSGLDNSQDVTTDTVLEHEHMHGTEHQKTTAGKASSAATDNLDDESAVQSSQPPGSAE